MELLQFLLDFFVKQFGGDKYSPLFCFLKENSFDVKKILSNFNPQVFEPIIKDFMDFNKNKNPTESVGNYGLNPIANLADSQIVYTLNKYFATSS